MKIKNRISPWTDPWGAPDNTGAGSEKVSRNQT